MPPWIHATAAWLRRQLAWSNSRRSWQERIGFLALIVTLAGGWYVSQSWEIELRVVLFCGWLTLLAILLRRGIIKLFGPVFFYEALRGTRKRVHLFRIIYAVVLFLAIVWVWATYTDPASTRAYSIRQQAEFAHTIYLVYFCVQMLVIVFMTPVVVASAIAEEKERRTLEFMLATDLRSREILLGKLAGRMANMTLYLLAALPIMSLLQLLGGIDPDLMLASFLGALLTYFSLSALSILFSTLQRRARDAIVLTFLAIAAYHGLSAALYLLMEIPGATTATFGFAGQAWTALDMINFANGGNLIVQLVDVVKALEMGGQSIGEVLAGILRNYAIFHVTIGVICLIWAAVRLRPVAKAQMAGGVTRRARAGRRHPEIGRWPMIWKEVFADTPRMHWMQKVIIALIVFVTFIPPVWITVENFANLITTPPGYTRGNIPMTWLRGNGVWHEFGQEINIWVRIISGLSGTILLVAVAVRAAGSISGERAKQTLDELLTTPLSNSEIVMAKWLGAIFSVRKGWIWMGLVYFTGMVTGGLNPLGAIAAMLAWFIFAAVFAGVGLWYSIHARSTFRATTYTLLSALFLLGFHWLLFLFCCMMPTVAAGSGPHSDLKLLGYFQLGLTPPATLGILPFMEWHELDGAGDNEVAMLVFQFIGLCIYFIGALGLPPLLVQRFGEQFSRTWLRRPEKRFILAAPVAAESPMEGPVATLGEKTEALADDKGTMT